jgi:chromosome segregation ATPase
MKKSNHNPVPAGTRTLHDILPKNASNITKGKQGAASKVIDMVQIAKEMDKLKGADYQDDSDDERSETIDKLKQVNDMLRDKVTELEKIVEDTISKAAIQSKPKKTYQRYWKVDNPELKKYDKELKFYKNKFESMKHVKSKDNIDINELKNQLADNERKNQAMEKDIIVLQKMQKNKKKKLQKLKNETAYEDKVRSKILTC